MNRSPGKAGRFNVLVTDGVMSIVFDPIADGPVSIEAASWSDVKGLFPGGAVAARRVPVTPSRFGIYFPAGPSGSAAPLPFFACLIRRFSFAVC